MLNISFPFFNLGFVTSIRDHENDVLLCFEVTHKVIRLGSVLEIIRGIERNVRGGTDAVRNAVLADFKNSIVMTVYNKKTYHVDDVNFSMSPKSKFVVNIKSKSDSCEVTTIKER